MCHETYVHSTLHTHTNTPRSIPALTVTDPLADQSPHASGRVWCWGLPSSPSCTPRHICWAHKYSIVGLQLRKHTHTHLTSLSDPSTHTYKCRHFLSLFLSLFSPSLSQPASLLLPSAASQPISREVTSWFAASAEAGLWICVCDRRERGRHTHGRNINSGFSVSLPDQLT